MDVNGCKWLECYVMLCDAMCMLDFPAWFPHAWRENGPKTRFWDPNRAPVWSQNPVLGPFLTQKDEKRHAWRQNGPKTRFWDPNGAPVWFQNPVLGPCYVNGFCYVNGVAM